MKLKTAERLLALCCGLMILCFLFCGKDRRAALLGIVFAFAGLILWLLFGRCPACGRYLGRISSGQYCPHCGQKLN